MNKIFILLHNFNVSLSMTHLYPKYQEFERLKVSLLSSTHNLFFIRLRRMVFIFYHEHTTAYQ